MSLLALAEAQARILAAIQPLSAEKLELRLSAGRVLRERIEASRDLPPFDNSAVDGYAVRSAELRAAAVGSPVRLTCLGSVPTGQSFPGPMTPGTCVRLFTGSPLPAGADAVVMQEDARLAPDQPALIGFLEPIAPRENVRYRGEDVRQGSPLIEAGERLTAGRIALLGALGHSEVTVGRTPVLALLATGSELVEPGQPLGPGQIYESNRAALAALARRAGAAPRLWPLVPDDPAATRTALEQAFAESDAVLTSGGVSVGERDYVKAAFAEMGGELDFWRVAIRPGKPFVFGHWRGKCLFGVPGNPVSALVTFWLLAAPALARMQGASDLNLPVRTGHLTEPLVNRGDRPHFLRVRFSPAGIVPAGLQASHALSSLARADGLVEVPPGTTLPPGSLVSVLVWD